ncbi:MAG: M4 family metallopeptidase, partial [Chitinophagales bacterium]
MNKSLFTLLLLLNISVLSIAQVFTGEKAIQINPNAQKIWINEDNNTLKYIAFIEAEAVQKQNHSQWLRELVSGNKNVNFKLNRVITDKVGQVHYRYDQYFSEHRVAGAQFILHTKNGKVLSANGDFVNTNAISLYTNFIQKEDAYELAKKSIPAKKYAPKQKEDLERNEGQIVLVKTKNDLSFAYKFDVYAITPLARYYVYVDAITGDVIKKDDRIHEISTDGTANCKYHGVQTITVDSVSPTNFTLNDALRNIATKDLNTGTNYATAVDFTDTDNNWNTTTNQDDAALDAHYGAEMTYDFFLTRYGLNSYNGAGASINSYVHYSTDYPNAFWNGTEMTYGDGDLIDYTALTSIDVVAHEVSHAVTEYSANLVYSYESGALNESFSDIFGVAIDFYADPANANWKMGDLFHITGDGFRDMSNPNVKGDPDTYLGTYWFTGSADNGGVHTNSGVQNYWYYLLTEGGSGINDLANSYNVTAIGMNDATDIAYRNLSLYLTTNSQYSDARFYSIQSAVDLFGACSQQEKSTTDAWYAVGVGALYANTVSSDFLASQTFFCTTPANVSFTNNSINDSNRVWDFGDGNTSTVLNPTHTYTNPGVYTVSLITNGSGACGAASDTLTISNYITVTNTGGPISANCTPPSNVGLSDYGIFNFTFNTINQSSLGAIEDYQDFTCAQSTNATEGDFINVSINTGTTLSHYVKMYLDANNDGVFAVSEEIYNNYAYNIHQDAVQIPLVTAHNTPLRLRVIADRYTITSTCSSSSNYSQIEDYSIIVSPNTNPPVTDFTSDFTTVNTGSTVTYTSLASGFPTSFLWNFPGGVPSSSTAASPTVTYNTVGIYNAQLTATNAFGSDTELKTDYMTVTNQINMCNGPASTSAQTGLLYDSGGSGGNYSNSENCYFLIQPACADSIILSFSQFSTESGYDRLRIYDGINTSAPLIATLQGNSLPTDVIATSGAMYVYFQSDGSVISSGFASTWSTVSTSSVAPIANFSASNTNPALGAPVQFTDLSLNTPIEWLWDFGDGNLSTIQNPTHSYVGSGSKTVSLIVSTCSFSDTITQVITVQAAPNLQVNPTSYTHTFNTCNDSTSVDFTIYNTGAGDLYIDTILGSATGDSIQSLQYFTASGQSTFHTFNALPSNIDSLYLTINMDGDFDSSSENARLIIDGIDLGIIPDFNVTVVNYEIILSGVQLSNFIADGSLIIEIDNSSGVDVFASNLNFHEVIIEYGNEADWIDVISNSDIISTGDSMTFSVQIDNFNITNGTYVDSISIFSNYFANNPFYIPVTLLNNGLAEMETNVNCLDFDTVSQNVVEVLPFEIYNSGCDTLNILSMSTITTEYSVSSFPTQIPPNTTDTVYVSFQSAVIGLKLDTLSIISNVNDTLICLSSYVEGAPNIAVNPDSLYVTINSCNDSLIVPLMVLNTGLGNLDINPIYTGGSSGGSVQNNAASAAIFRDALAWGSNANVINLNNLGYNVSIYNSSAMATAFLDTFDLILFESSQSNLFYQTFQTNISRFTNYVTNGGNLQFNVSTASSNRLSNLAMVGGAQIGVNEYLEATNTITDTSHVMFSGCGITQISGNYSSHEYFTNLPANASILTTNSVGEPTTIEYSFGSGHVLNTALTLEHMYQNNFSCASLLENTFESQTSYYNVNWLYTSLDSMYIVPQDSQLLNVVFNSTGLTNGVYNGGVNFQSNDPSAPIYTIPVVFNVDGNAEIELSVNCLNYDSIIANETKVDSFNITNNGCDTLFVTNISSANSSYTANTTNFYVLPGEYQSVSISFNPSNTGNMNSDLLIENSVSDTTICLIAYSTDPPIINITPSVITENISCGASITTPLNIYNSGVGNLVYTINGTSSDSAHILVLTNGVDYTGEYANTLTAINTYVNKYTITEMSSTSLAVFDQNLIGKNVVLIPEIESGSITHFSNFASSLQSFVNNGGSVIFAGTGNSYSNAIFNTGLLSGSYNTNVNSGVMTTNLPSHFLLDSVTLPLQAINATYKYDISNIDADIIAEHNGYATIVHRPIGSGQVILLGYDFYNNSIQSSRIIANAVKSATTSGGLNANWINLSLLTDTLANNDTSFIDVTLDASNLYAGLYYDTIFVESNDLANTPVAVPVEFTVTGQAGINITPSVLNLGTLQVGASSSETVFIENTGCDTLQISSFLATNTSFSINATNLSISPFSSDSVLVSFTPNAIQTFNDTIFIFNNDSTAFVLVNGEGVGAPVISTNPTAIIDTIFGCNDSISVPLTIYNTGQGFLDVEVLNNSAVNSATGFFDGFESGNFATWTNNSGTYSKQVVNFGAASGNYALAFTNGSTNHTDGISKNVGILNPDYISFKIKSDINNQYGSFTSIQDNLGRE